MKSTILFFFTLQAIINDVNLVVATSPKKDRHVCRGGDFKSDTIRKNRDSAFNKLVALIKNSSYHGFLHVQAGDKPEEQVSMTFLCAPAIGKARCECGVKDTFNYLLKSCPKQNEGVAWDIYFYFNVMVRYSTGRKILSVLDDWAWYSFPFVYKVSAIALEKTMDSFGSKLKEQAAGGDANQKYANGSVNYDGEEFKLHVAVQCTPDITKAVCIKCLSKASTEIRNCCTSKPLFHGRTFSTNCYIWYMHINIFDVPITFDPESCS
ncbi:cysteine-rich repeat secretory protein 1-like [Bidens hawaiensis]|uniref:cysteine-rich repeat secretory protein 1-like n=1 Tax=Bidens hawaiensis TaxID=980011 RepID=UPI00404BA324